jgi:beta-amylase
MIKKKVGVFILLFFSLFITSFALARNPYPPKIKNYKMWHLEPSGDRESIRRELLGLKNNQKADAVSIDMWWGLIEKEKDVYDWSYLDMFFEVAEEVGIKVIPIFSTHSAGGNYNDNADFKVGIPEYVWKLARDMQYVDINGFTSKEVPSVLVPELMPRFEKLMQSFADRYRNKKDLFEAFYPPSSASGEYRYPSYSAAAGWNYPHPGFYQVYSRRSKMSFRLFLREKYKNVAALNTTWGTNLTSFFQVDPPSRSDMPLFNREAGHSPYSEDFLTWYQSGLLNYTEKIFDIAHRIFDPIFGVPLEAKIPGITWLMVDPDVPHGAEYATGLYKYQKIIELFSRIKAVLTLTCLEHTNEDRYFSRFQNQNPIPDYSRPDDLLAELAYWVNWYHVKWGAENAGPLRWEFLYQRARANLIKWGFVSMTELRADDLIDNQGNNTDQGHNSVRYLSEVPRNDKKPFGLEGNDPVEALLQECGKLNQSSSPSKNLN